MQVDLANGKVPNYRLFDSPGQTLHPGNLNNSKKSVTYVGESRFANQKDHHIQSLKFLSEK